MRGEKIIYIHEIKVRKHKWTFKPYLLITVIHQKNMFFKVFYFQSLQLCDLILEYFLSRYALNFLPVSDASVTATFLAADSFVDGDNLIPKIYFKIKFKQFL